MELTTPVEHGVAATTDGHVAVLELARPPANYFDVEMLTRLADLAEDLQTDPSVRALVLCARGKHFCAGADFSSPAMLADRVGTAAQVYAQAVRLIGLEVPVVAAVHGGAVGGGLGLACAADLRVGSSTSWFHANFARLGIHHGFGLSLTLPRIVGPQAARRMLLLAERVHGEAALATGLLDELVDPGGERAAALDLAHRVAASTAGATRAIKRTQTDDQRAALLSAVEHELSEQRRLWAEADEDTDERTDA